MAGDINQFEMYAKYDKICEFNFKINISVRKQQYFVNDNKLQDCVYFEDDDMTLYTDNNIKICDNENNFTLILLFYFDCLLETSDTISITNFNALDDLLKKRVRNWRCYKLL